MNKFMRIMVFFDLPVKTKAQRREATRFRNFLLVDGYHMLQYSVYARVCNGMDAVEKHRQRVKQNLPENGAIRLMVITEKQYEAIDILLGKLTEADDKFQCEQLSTFPVAYHTIPRTTRELQPKACCFADAHHRKSEEVYNRTLTSGESFLPLPQPWLPDARYTEQGRITNNKKNNPPPSQH